MASPPFNLDVADPADNAIVSQFPLNERTFRDNTNSYLNVEHDISTGYHKFQILSTTAKTALTSPPTGMLVFDSTLGVAQINTGTSGAPVWTTLGAQTGDIKMWPTTTAPSGWLNCDGSAVSRTTYANLFALIGTTFGAGNGSTTFNVPDFRGCVPAGYDPGNSTGRLTGASGGVSAATMGAAGGEQTHTLTVGEMPSHSHGVNETPHSHGLTNVNLIYTSGAGPYDFVGGSSFNRPAGNSTDSASTGITIQANGSGGAHNNVQPTRIIGFVIKT